MTYKEPSFISKIGRSWPWLVRYPFERAASFARRTAFERKHVIITIADHFEPGWSADGILGFDEQRRRVADFLEKARRTGDAVRDADGTKFRHTFFYPAEQYDREILDMLRTAQAEGFGETEVHLHHGMNGPDTPENLRRTLLDYAELISTEHKMLSLLDGKGMPRWAFVHGNLALANSADGRYCGVDNEMEILEQTGCYADMTMPSAPDITQVPVINKIYECGLPHDEPVPHRKAQPVRQGAPELRFPLIFQGPLVFNWRRRIQGIPFPRIDDGALEASQPRDLARFSRWLNANVTVRGRSDWIFVKLHCHGFFDYDQSASVGDDARRFFETIIENGDRTGEYKIYFASAREAVNMVFAAIDEMPGSPGEYRDYRLRQIMRPAAPGAEKN